MDDDEYYKNQKELAEIARKTASIPQRYEHISSQKGKLAKATLAQTKSQLMRARTLRNQTFLPLIGTLLLIFLFVGPSVSILVSIFSGVNPLLWIGLVFILLWLWRRYI